MAELHPLVEQVLKEAEEKRRAMRRRAVLEMVRLAAETMPELQRLVEGGALEVNEELGWLVGVGLAPLRLKQVNDRIVVQVGRWDGLRKRWRFAGHGLEDAGQALLLARKRYEEAQTNHSEKEVLG